MQSRRILFRFALAILAVVLSAWTLAAQEHHHAGGGEVMGGGNLGQVHFPTSCAPSVQPDFEKGVALLHSFQYSASDQVFKQVAAADPSCAIAYWGEAMTLWHALWERPDASTLKSGRDEIEKAGGLNAETAREREYIAAVAAFFKDDAKLDYAGRAKAYSSAMGAIYEHYPEDGEAAAFYGLSLISIPAHGDEDLANRRHAIVVLNKLFAAEPGHPGAAHYLIHACDTPELAPQGLIAARAYARIAPDSSHALHMPSHIFSRLGLWQESIDSNIAAAAAAEQATKVHLGEANYQLHAMDYLEYAYLQSGHNSDAQHVIDEVPSVPGASPSEISDHLATFRARYALETHDWKMAAALDPPAVELYAQDTTWWARAIGAARSGDVAGSHTDVEKLAAATAESKARSKKEGYEVKDEKSIDQLEADAWLAYAQGNKDEALKTLRAAADRQDKEDPGDLGIPAREMLGDMLMESNQPDAALAAYQIALKESPNRLDSLHGVELASKATGKEQPAGGKE
jgi:tetratricopeptide (TPR) repeat protein